MPVSFRFKRVLYRFLTTYYKVNLDVLNSLILRFRCSGIFVCRGCPVVLLLIVLCCAADCPYLCTVVVVCVVCRVRGSLHTITPTSAPVGSHHPIYIHIYNNTYFTRTMNERTSDLRTSARTITERDKFALQLPSNVKTNV